MVLLSALGRIAITKETKHLLDREYNYVANERKKEG